MTCKYASPSFQGPLVETTTLRASPESEIAAALEEYFALVERGDGPSRAEFLARHPTIADALAECLDGLDFVNRAAGEFSPEAAQADIIRSCLPVQVLGDFRLIREIGRGGMGIVYEAEQLSLGRRVALKVLPSGAALDPRHRQRFQVEAQAVALLHHDHIVPIFGVGSDQGAHYLAMQLIDGPSLIQVIQDLRHGQSARTVMQPGSSQTDNAEQPAPGRSGTPRSSTQSSAIRERCLAAARLGIEAAGAIEHAHQLGVIHRDIKPSNLLLDRQGKLWVADFGLARLPESEHDLTRTGDLIGTYRYMSPEQVRAERGSVGCATDIYSLGATLYELITLRPVFDSQDRHELLRKIQHDEPVPLRRQLPAVPRDLETIVLKALEKDPSARYSSARALADDLNHFLRDEPLQARRPGMADRAVKWVRRHRTAAAVSTTALILTLAVASALLWQAKRQADAHILAYGKALRLQRLGMEYAMGAFDQITRARLAHRQAGALADPETAQTLAAVLSFYDRIPGGFCEGDRAIEAVARAYRQAGFCRMVLRRPEGRANYRDAIASYEKALARYPEQIWLRTGLIETVLEYASFLTATEDHSEAESLLRQALVTADTMVDNPKANYPCYTAALSPAVSALAWTLVRESQPHPDDTAHAIRLARQATTWQPQQADGWRALGLGLLRQGDLQAAIQALDHARELGQTTDPVVLLYLAASYQKAGDHELARRRFAEAGTQIEQATSADPEQRAEMERIRDEVAQILWD